MSEEEQKTLEKAKKEQEEKILQLEMQNEQLMMLKDTLAKDPNVLKALEASRAGRTVNFVEEKAQRTLSQKVSDQQASPEVDLESLSNTQLVSYIVDRVSDAVESHVDGVTEDAGRQFEERLSILDNNLTKTQKLILAQAYKTSKDSVRVKYPDFVKFEKEVDNYVQAYGIPLEDAYRIVKSQHVGDEPLASETASERPTGAATRRAAARTDADASLSSGRVASDEIKARSPRRTRASFRELLQRGIDGTVK